MNDYRLFGLEMSPYSVKVRAYLRYKGIPHQWVVRSMDQMAEFGKYAKLPLVPCLACPDGSGLQDSTPIIEALEQHFATPSLSVGDVALDFLSTLIEEYADEWCNKFMFHFRWYYEPDADSAALRIAQEMTPAGAPEGTAQSMAPSLKARMVPRLGFVGSGRDQPENAALIEASFRQHAAWLNAHLAGRPYLFGGRPVLADFGLYGQLKELLSDPTPGAWLHEHAPQVVGYVARMETPTVQGDIEPFAQLQESLGTLLRIDVGARFLPWSTANADALQNAQPSFTVNLDGQAFTQETQKYHARSLAALRKKFTQAARDERLISLLNATGCLQWLQR